MQQVISHLPFLIYHHPPPQFLETFSVVVEESLYAMTQHSRGQSTRAS